MTYTTATLTGTYHTTDGQPAVGTVEIAPNSRILIDTEGDVILSGMVTVALDESGSFSVVLPSTDDATVEPATGRQYRVEVNLTHRHFPPVRVELAAGETVDMADVTSATETAAALSVWLTEDEFTAVVDRVAALEESPGGVTTVNGEAGAVTLSAADVGADPAGAAAAAEAAALTADEAKLNVADLDAETAERVQSGPLTKAALSASYARSPQSAQVASLPTGFVLAHRGGLAVMPDESFEAFRAAVGGGAHGIEFDVRMLADGTLAVMHDSTVDRTTTGTGNVDRFTEPSFRRLSIDAGGLLPGGGWTTATTVVVDDLLRSFGNRTVLAPQIIGDSFNSNDVVAAALMDALARNNIDKGTVLMQTGQDYTVEQVRAQGYACSIIDGTVAAAISSGAEFWSCNFTTVSDADIQTAIAAGIKVIPYTVNNHWQRDYYLALGVEGFYTDDPLYLKGARTKRDLFTGQTWVPGLRANNSDRGKFYAPNQWGYDLSGSAATLALHGALRPADPTGTWTLDFSLQIDAVNGGDTSRGASVFLGTTDRAFYDQAATIGEGLRGYYFLARANGQSGIYKYDNDTDTKAIIGSVGTLGTAPTLGAITSYRITFTAATIKIERTDVSGTPITVTDSTFRPSYLSLGRFGAGVRFSNVTVTG